MIYEVRYQVYGLMLVDSEHKESAYQEAREKVMKVEGSRDCELEVTESKVDLYA